MVKFILLSGFSRVLINKRLIYRKVIAHDSSKNSYIVIPEIPKKSTVTLEKNSSKLWDNFINFSRSVHDFETEFSSLFENLSKASNDLNFENSLLKMENIIRDNDLKFKSLRICYDINDEPISKIIFGKLLNKTLIANLHINFNPKIYDICLKLLQTNLNESQKNYLNNIVDNIKLYGTELPNDARNSLQNSIDQLFESQLNFINSLKVSTENVVHYINKIEMSQFTPQNLLSQLSCPDNENLLRIHFNYSESVFLFLKYCTNHKVRNQIWLILRQLGGKAVFDSNQSNFNNIENIRSNRKNIAKIFGQKNYCDVLFNNNKRMAKSLDEVVDVLQTAKDSIIPNAEYEYKHVLEYAQKAKGLKDDMLICDYNYLHDCFSHDIKQCPWAEVRSGKFSFHIEKIINRIFFILGKFFDISYKNSSENQDNFIYSIYNGKDGKLIGEIIFQFSNVKFDLEKICERRSNPTSFISVNLLNEQINLFDSLKLIMHIGKALEKLHNNIDFDVATLYSYPSLDIHYIVPYFLLHSFISSKNIFAYLFSELSTEDLKNLNHSYISPSQSFFNNVQMVENLMYSNFDIKIWSDKSHWRNIQNDLWSEFFTSNSKLYFPYEKLDVWPCSAVNIFANQIWGGVTLYSIFWAEHVLKLLMVHFTSADFYDWQPSNSLNPQLSMLFSKFKKLFIEDQLTCKSNAIHQFIN